LLSVKTSHRSKSFCESAILKDPILLGSARVITGNALLKQHSRGHRALEHCTAHSITDCARTDDSSSKPASLPLLPLLRICLAGNK
jgi:hypothetical protein